MSDIRVTNVESLRALAGQEIGVSQWLLITQEMVDAFAHVTGDHQYIHVDPERAAQTIFGGTIAHGYLTLALLPRLTRERGGVQIDLGARMTVNYGSNRVRFPGPVHVGKRIRLRTKVLAVEEVSASGAGTAGDAGGQRPGAIQVTWQQTVEVEGGDRPGMVAETLTRYYV
ncbi:MAG TPA: MaoC family dehydratase [Chloroflexota bacterium]|nr:MaoC family dehydratase [Chloroflexota bacterium]